MKQPDININSPTLGNPNDTREMAAFTTKISDLFQEAFDHIQRVRILTVAPTGTQLQEFLDESDVVILHHATQANRKIYYRYQGTVFSIASA